MSETTYTVKPGYSKGGKGRFTKVASPCKFEFTHWESYVACDEPGAQYRIDFAMRNPYCRRGNASRARIVVYSRPGICGFGFIWLLLGIPEKDSC